MGIEEDCLAVFPGFVLALKKLAVLSADFEMVVRSGVEKAGRVRRAKRQSFKKFRSDGGKRVAHAGFAKRLRDFAMTAGARGAPHIAVPIGRVRSRRWESGALSRSWLARIADETGGERESC